MDRNFNIIITGVGGQGVITLVSVLTQACLNQGYDVKSSELHGLSQRGGSVIAHIRFGKKVLSPLVQKGQADLVMSLELLESLRYAGFANSKTIFLVNKYSVGFQGYPSEQEIVFNLEKIAGSNLYFIEASKIAREKLEKEVLSVIYLLGCAVYKKIIPLKPESVLEAIEKVIPEKYREMNIKAFNLANDK